MEKECLARTTQVLREVLEKTYDAWSFLFFTDCYFFLPGTVPQEGWQKAGGLSCNHCQRLANFSFFYKSILNCTSACNYYYKSVLMCFCSLVTKDLLGTMRWRLAANSIQQQKRLRLNALKVETLY